MSLTYFLLQDKSPFMSSSSNSSARTHNGGRSGSSATTSSGGGGRRAGPNGHSSTMQMDNGPGRRGHLVLSERGWEPMGATNTMGGPGMLETRLGREGENLVGQVWKSRAQMRNSL